MIRVIIAGSRTFNDFQLMKNNVDSIFNEHIYGKGFSKDDITVVCGMASGADLLGKQYAEMNGIKVKCFPANWDLYGNSAGYIRNEEMAKYASYKKGYGALIAFWNGNSRGTKNMIDLANKYGLKVFIIGWRIFG